MSRMYHMRHACYAMHRNVSINGSSVAKCELNGAYGFEKFLWLTMALRRPDTNVI